MMLIGCIIVLILLSRSGAGGAGAGGAGAGGGSVVDRVIDFFKGGKATAESSDSASVGSLSRAGGKAEELSSDVIDAK